MRSLAGKTRRSHERGFSRRDALCASAGQGLPDDRAFHSHLIRRRTAGGLPGKCSSGAKGVVAGVQSLPLQGARSNGRWPSGERPGDNADGGFLGGARSPRPDCDAVRKPRHVIIADELARGGSPSGDMPRLYPGHFCGRAEPAPCILRTSTKYPGYVSTTYTLEYPVPPRTSTPVPPLPLPSTYPPEGGVVGGMGMTRGVG